MDVCVCFYGDFLNAVCVSCSYPFLKIQVSLYNVHISGWLNMVSVWSFENDVIVSFQFLAKKD